MRDATPPAQSIPSTRPAPANRAERRAAARGRSAGTDGRPAAPRRTGPRTDSRLARARADFVARRSG
ncbi:hypothetical protein [Actinomycetospora straminea]|uniref:Uncharacterized protein n=1 Tax=Actinomycetospora straminea TaxID=663607 RepID=A0ABP9E223_9PSEU|nr:hypothetical protein [Actinomycetospora straminea]MDD7931433.1 hypothetical protein [Actinomycetospora straminea]